VLLLFSAIISQTAVFFWKNELLLLSVPTAFFLTVQYVLLFSRLQVVPAVKAAAADRLVVRRTHAKETQR